MPPKKRPPAVPHRETMIVEWPLFGELSRVLALKVSRKFDPEIVIGELHTNRKYDGFEGV